MLFVIVRFVASSDPVLIRVKLGSYIGPREVEEEPYGHRVEPECNQVVVVNSRSNLVLRRSRESHPAQLKEFYSEPKYQGKSPQAAEGVLTRTQLKKVPTRTWIPEIRRLFGKEIFLDTSYPE